MSSLKDMYRTVLKDTFPDTMTITLGDAVLTYKKRTWHIDGETKGLRYGENPDQPAALYEMESGKRAIPGFEGKAWADLSEAEQADVLNDFRLAYISKSPVNWCPGLGTS